MFAVTMVGPIGADIRSAVIIPNIAHTTDIIREEITTLLKLLNKRIEESAGKIIRAEMSREPTRFIASTIITAITIASIVL